MARGEVDVLNRVFKCQVFFQLRSAAMQTQFHLRDAGAPTSTPQDVLNDVETFVQTEWKSSVSSNIQITKISVLRLIENTFAQKEFVGNVGTLLFPQKATMLASVISLKSAYRERSANGRMFWPAANSPEGDNIDPQAYAALLLSAQKMQDRYCGPALTSLRKLVIVSYPKKVGDPPAFPVPMPPTLWADVDVVRVNPIVTAVRSRKAGVGS